ncbi:hypothetical protein [Hymenobacter sp. BT190]|uniref:hypothetical protein n=1 Tax=Hymenobacter sp. BT190 TaxID=2763505 RepID=UPI0016517BB3|nr:hypothetical protein [Hymenobacter sp. BT190]MBC6697667.1 hypothetical protein [Hymenobacter sp. BT190]
MLLLPETAPEALFGLALHTHLQLGLRYAGGHTAALVASVEEIARAGSLEVRALLLAEPGIEPVPAGTEVWWDGTESADAW